MSSGAKEALDESDHYQYLCKRYKEKSQGHYYSIDDKWRKHYELLLSKIQKDQEKK